MHHALETEIIELEQVEIRTHAAASDSSWHLAEAKAWLADSIIEFGLGIDSINLVAVFWHSGKWNKTVDVPSESFDRIVNVVYKEVLIR